MSNVGKTFAALWAMRSSRLELSLTDACVMYSFIAFMNADGIAAPGTARLMRAAHCGRAAVQRSVDRLESLGMIALVSPSSEKRCAVYKIVQEAIIDPVDASPLSDPASPGIPGSVEGPPGISQMPPWHPSDAPPGILGRPFEDYEDLERINEDQASPPLAPSQAPSASSASPTTARSPATMLPVHEALLSNAQDPTMPLSPYPTKQRKPRATKPKPAPLAVDQLTTEERAVHDAIVQDPTLVQICHNVPQLARDLVNIAAGRIDVVAKVRALGAWNRNNPSKAWTTAGGNRGLTGCVQRDAGHASSGYAPMRPSYIPAPAIGIQPSPPPRVQIVAPPPPPKDDLPKPLPGEETFLQRMARIDPQARRILEQNGKPQ